MKQKIDKKKGFFPAILQERQKPELLLRIPHQKRFYILFYPVRYVYEKEKERANYLLEWANIACSLPLDSCLVMDFSGFEIRFRLLHLNKFYL
jgi:hypothetical protein